MWSSGRKNDENGASRQTASQTVNQTGQAAAAAVAESYAKDIYSTRSVTEPELREQNCIIAVTEILYCSVHHSLPFKPT